MSPVPPVEPPGKPALDISQLRKNSVFKHKDGRSLFLTGLFLSNDGPVFMGKLSPTQTVAENVPIANIDSLI